MGQRGVLSDAAGGVQHDLVAAGDVGDGVDDVDKGGGGDGDDDDGGVSDGVFGGGDPLIPTTFVPLGSFPGVSEDPGDPTNPPPPTDPDTPPPPVVAIPEPATWGLFIAGTFASGFMLRRRRRRVTAPQAV